jgi:uncharacterized membrane protein YphA (DoxX/SURF4 family)
MDTALWIAQALLAAIFITSGTVKLTQSRAKMAAGPMPWAADVTDAQFRTVGALEILGVVGLAVAAALNLPVLAVLAAAGLALTMVGAILTHVRLGETARIAVPAVVLVVALFVGVGIPGQ